METLAALTPARHRVLAEIRSGGRPVTLAELVTRTGLHENTLRGHLEALVRDDRVTRVAVRRERPGRPAWGYLAREDEYAALATALATALDGTRDDPREAAVRGGRAWGERLSGQLGAGARQGPRERLLLALEHTGFAPEADGDTVRLTRCPLLQAARAHQGVVCGAHLGLIEGVLGAAGARLEPFAEPGACLVELP